MTKQTCVDCGEKLITQGDRDHGLCLICLGMHLFVGDLIVSDPIENTSIEASAPMAD